MTPTSLDLHYVSRRAGLGSLVEGLVEELAREYFDAEVHIRLLRGRHDGSCDHEVRGAGCSRVTCTAAPFNRMWGGGSCDHEVGGPAGEAGGWPVLRLCA